MEHIPPTERILQVDPTRALIQSAEHTDYYYDLGDTHCLLGNILALLNTEFPDYNGNTKQEEAAYLLQHVLGRLGTIVTTPDGERVRIEPPVRKNLLDYQEDGYARIWFWDVWEKLQRSKDGLSMRFMEEIRMTYDIRVFPSQARDLQKGDFVFDKTKVHFQNVTSVRALLYSALYYYALQGWKIRKCEHCGQYFATKSLKNKYCPRRSPMRDPDDASFDYTGMTCQRAVEAAKDRLAKAYTRERKRLWGWRERTVAFLKAVDVHKDAIKKSASAEALIAYNEFLRDPENKRGKGERSFYQRGEQDV